MSPEILYWRLSPVASTLLSVATDLAACFCPRNSEKWIIVGGEQHARCFVTLETFHSRVVSVASSLLSIHAYKLSA